MRTHVQFLSDFISICNFYLCDFENRAPLKFQNVCDYFYKYLQGKKILFWIIIIDIKNFAHN